jgi:hypothetical protein
MKAGSYTINVNPIKKVVDMVIVGTWTPKQVEDFVRDYQRKVSSIDAKLFDLKVDCTDMDVITQDMIPRLENSFRMYKETGFKKVIFTIKKNPIIKMQLNRVARNTGLTNSEVVEA